jgi:hypothetical protein
MRDVSLGPSRCGGGTPITSIDPNSDRRHPGTNDKSIPRASTSFSASHQSRSRSPRPSCCSSNRRHLGSKHPEDHEACSSDHHQESKNYVKHIRQRDFVQIVFHLFFPPYPVVPKGEIGQSSTETSRSANALLGRVAQILRTMNPSLLRPPFSYKNGSHQETADRGYS